MKIIKPGHQHMKHDDLTPQQFVELIGRTCYKSTDKITDDSSERFVNNLIERKHWAMLEHEHIFISMKTVNINRLVMEFETERNTDEGCTIKFLNITYDDGTGYGIISGSIRSFYDLLKAKHSSMVLACIGEKLVEKYPWAFKDILNIHIESTCCEEIAIGNRNVFIEAYKHNSKVMFRHLTHTVKFICDRGVSHELVRHRPVSFAQESTRYCNYSKDKFGREITVIEPIFYVENAYKCDKSTNKTVYDIWKESCEFAEKSYFELLDLGSTPQEARDVLPNSLKTEIIMTATEEEWQHIVNLRAKGTTGQPHPQMVEIIEPWYEELKEITDGRIS